VDEMLYFSLFSSPSNEDSSCNESCPSSEGAIEPALPGLINRDEDGIIPRLLDISDYSLDSINDVFVPAIFHYT